MSAETETGGQKTTGERLLRRHAGEPEALSAEDRPQPVCDDGLAAEPIIFLVFGLEQLYSSATADAASVVLS